MDKNILSDSNLESLNIIKEIDTLSIINKADLIMKKRERKKINIIGIAICILLSIFNVITVLTSGVKIFIIIQLIILWFSPVFIILCIKGLGRKGEVK